MSNADNAYDNRQYRRMSQALDRFESNEIGLGTLINTLSALIDVLRVPPTGWVREFRSTWWDLEQVYAVALDRGTDPLSGSDGESVRQTVRELRSLIPEVGESEDDEYE